MYDLWNLTCSFNSIWEEAKVKSPFSRPHGHGFKILTIKGSWCKTPLPQCYYVDVKVMASKVNTIRSQRKQRSSYTLIKKETWKRSCVIRNHILSFVLDVLSFFLFSWIMIALRCSDLPTVNSIALVKNKWYKNLETLAVHQYISLGHSSNYMTFSVDFLENYLCCVVFFIKCARQLRLLYNSARRKLREYHATCFSWRLTSRYS